MNWGNPGKIQLNTKKMLEQYNIGTTNEAECLDFSNLKWYKKLKSCCASKTNYLLLKPDQSIFKNMETKKDMFMGLSSWTNWVNSMKIKLKCGYLQTETSLASTACNHAEKNPIFLSLHRGYRL